MGIWQAYVDQQLIGTGAVNQAAIVGQDGTSWAASSGFSVSPVEGRNLWALFDNPTEAMAKGIMLAGGKYVTIKADNRSIYGKKGPVGAVAARTGTAIVIGIYGEGQQPGNAAGVVEKLADHVIEDGT